LQIRDESQSTSL